MLRTTANTCDFYDGERTEEAQFQRRILKEIRYEKLPPSLWEDYFTRHDEDVIPARQLAERIINLRGELSRSLRPAQILCRGDLSEAGLNKIMAQGIAEEGFSAVHLRACFIPFSLVD